MRIPILLTFILFFLLKASSAQTLSPNQTANQLVNTLVGDGVSFSNASLICGNNASGKFNNTLTTGLQMDSGIVLTTGTVLDVLQSPLTFSSVNNLSNNPDANLQAAATGAIYNLCKLEFDFVPIGDTIQFKYIFGSEEYTNYTCSNFNDIFSFFINGPGYPTPTNLALIPGTNCPVSINTVNGSTANPCGNVGSPCAPPNNALYTNNSFGTSIVYDGITKKLTAKASVIPCSTYHMKFAIADVFDEILDSGVFLEANSFKSDAAYISLITNSNSLPSATPFSIEGCNAATVTLKRPFPMSFPQPVTIVLGGTAINGVDVSTIPSVVTIPANDTIVTFPINAIEDYVPEGTEFLTLYVYGSACNAVATDSTTIAIQEFPSYSVSDSVFICQGQNAVLSAVPNPANGNLSFVWTGGPAPVNGASMNVSPTTTTSYTVSASYPGCLNKDSVVSVLVDPIPVLQLNSTNVSCLNPNGSITASATGNSPFTYTLQPGSISQSTTPALFAGLSAATYTVAVSSGIANCTSTQTVVINSISGLTWNSQSSTMPNCAGASNGSLSLSVSGGNGVYSYQLQPGALINTSGNFAGIAANTYTVTAQDGTGCTISTTVVVNEPSPIVISNVLSDSTTCYGYTDGQIQVSASGGTGALNYTLTPGGITNTSGLFGSLGASAYTITVTDANACSASTVVNVEEPTLIQWTALSVNDVLCNGANNGTVNMNTQGGTGATVYWLQPINLNNQTGTFSNLSQGIYTASAVDANGCTQSSTLTINQPSALQINNVSNTIPSCVPGNDASITMGASGGTTNYTYSINGGAGQSSGTFTGLGSGVYTIQVTDANNCTQTSTVSIDNPPSLMLLSSQSSPSICNGQNSGTITVLVGGGTGTIIYNLMPSSITNQTGVFSSISAGAYTITAIDQLGCSIVTPLSVSQPPAIVFASTLTDSTSCTSSTDGGITVSAMGGTGTINYTLNPGNQSNLTGQFSNLGSQIYTVTASDINGCSSSVSLSVSAPVTINWGAVSSTSITCFGLSNGSINVTANGGTGNITYLLQPGSTSNFTGFFNGLPSGLYTVTATDANNCFITSTLSLAQPVPLNIVSINTTLESCSPGNDGTATILVNGGVPNYSFSYASAPTQSSNVLQGLSNGSYTVTVSDANNCTKTSAFQINTPAAHIWNAPVTGAVTCNGLQNGSISATINNGTNPLLYSLSPVGTSNSTGSFSNLPAGNYTVSVSDALNCVSSTAVSVNQPSPIQMIISNTTSPTCFGLVNGNAAYQATGGVGTIQYQLQPSGSTNTNGNFINLAGGQYTVVATDANACSITTSFSLINPPAINILNVNVANTSCNPNNIGAISLSANGGTPPLQYSNNGSPFTTNSIFSGLVAGNYNVVVMDANNCSVNTSVIISEPAPPLFSFLSVLDNKCHNDTLGQIQIVASGPHTITSYQLNPGNLSSGVGFFNNLLGGTYVITATDSKGCTVTSFIDLDNPNPLQFTEFEGMNANCAEKYSANLTTSAIGGTGLLKYTLTPSSATNNSGDFSNLPPGAYTITVSDQNNCSINNSANLIQEICCDKIFVPNAFTPNGDGKNDEFRMVNAFGIQLLDFSVVNRWGNIVFKSVSEEVGWNGRQHGEDCEVGTYYYLIKYRCLYSGQEYLLKGDIALIR